jgi:hypothetical protein
MLSHGWTYQALVSNCLSIKLNLYGSHTAGQAHKSCILKIDQHIRMGNLRQLARPHPYFLLSGSHRSYEPCTLAHTGPAENGGQG